jgi:hypothetical protein
MTEQPRRNPDTPPHSGGSWFHRRFPGRLPRWAARAVLLQSYRAAGAAEATYFAARRRGVSRDVAARQAFRSIVFDEGGAFHDGDAERARLLVDTGHGAPSAHWQTPVTEMDQALGALAMDRDPAHSNADTYVIALCVLAFASVAFLGFYSVDAARKGDGAASAPAALSCGGETGRPPADRYASIGTTCP